MLRSKSLIPVRIGALLTSAGLIKPEVLAHALQKARATGERVGDQLVEAGIISERDLDTAAQIQKLIKGGTITVEMGINALRTAAEKGKPVNVALREHGWEDSRSIKINELAQLLLDAQFITKAQLEQATWNCAKNNLPLGRNLILLNIITPSILAAALNALVLIRDGRTNEKAAAMALRVSVSQLLTIEEALGLPNWVTAQHVRVGELLALAGILSETDAINAVEFGLLNQVPIGKVLLDSNLVAPKVLEACLQLQRLIASDELTRIQAAEVLKQVAYTGVTVDAYLHRMSQAKDRAMALLLAAELVTTEHVIDAREQHPAYVRDVARALLTAGYLPVEVFRTALRCVFLIDDGSMDEATAVLELQNQFSYLIQPHRLPGPRALDLEDDEVLTEEFTPFAGEVGLTA